ALDQRAEGLERPREEAAGAERVLLARSAARLWRWLLAEVRDRAQQRAALPGGTAILLGKRELEGGARLRLRLQGVEQRDEVQLHPLREALGDRLSDPVPRGVLELEYAAGHQRRVVHLHGRDGAYAAVAQRLDGGDLRHDREPAVDVMKPPRALLDRVSVLRE